MQTEIKETEKEITDNILLVLMELDTLNSSFESYSDTENPELGQSSQKPHDKSLDKSSKKNKNEFSSGARLKENVLVKILEA